MRTSPNRLVATIFGALFVVLGIAGFFATAGIGFFSIHGALLFGIFEVNLIHNLANLLIGIVLLIAGMRTVSASRSVNTAIGSVYLVLGLVGLFVIGTELNILALNGADNVLHFGSAVVLLAVGLGSDRATADEPATASRQ